MSKYVRTPTNAVAFTPSIGGPVVAAAAADLVSRTAPSVVPVQPPDGLVQVGQVGGSPHVAAMFGIVALALLGGILAARNRLSERASLAAESDHHTDEFVTDQEKIRQLVTENGGRMKQSRIVESVDWSKAKVSRLLAELEDDGQITKLRLGRENLVCLPGHEPTASQSPEQSQKE